KQEKTVESYMVSDHQFCPQIEIYTIEGPLFFGAATVFEQRVMNSINHKPKVLILRMRQVPFMDATGVANLSNIVRSFQKQGGTILISGSLDYVKEILKTSGVYDQIGEEN